jgi:hypothetical protein
MPSLKSNSIGGFMGQAQVSRFPGFGIIYPDGVNGIKVVRTYTQGPSKVVNPDGSVGYTTPPPTILELFGGGFAYADGSPVNDRLHLEMMSDVKMRERALIWFDSHGKVSTIATEDVPPLDLEHKERPEPVYVLSSDLPTEQDAVTADVNEHIRKVEKGSGIDPMLQVLEGIKNLTSLVKAQDDRIGKLEAGTNPMRESRKAQSEKMKAKWADPAYREKVLGKKNGKNIPETTKEV